MLETLIHHPIASIIGLLFIVALTFGANQMGLMAWLSWLDRRENDSRGSQRRDSGSHGDAATHYWRVHQ
jgi:hypothetical protein